MALKAYHFLKNAQLGYKMIKDEFLKKQPA